MVEDFLGESASTNVTVEGRFTMPESILDVTVFFVFWAEADYSGSEALQNYINIMYRPFEGFLIIVENWD